jgi:hypothetical protein
MASIQAVHKLLGNAKITAYDFDNAADPVDVAWVDMQNYRCFTALVFHSVGTSKIDTFSILANAQSDGSGTDITIKAHGGQGGSGFLDAVGDYGFLEITAEEVAQEAADAGITGARYVSVSLEMNNATDEAVVVYILSEPRFASQNLSADFQA